MSNFIAKFRFEEGDSGFPAGKLIFGESGVVGIPTRHDNSKDRATIGIHLGPNAEIFNGEEFEAECSVLAPEYWRDKLFIGYTFKVGYPSDMVTAEIVDLL